METNTELDIAAEQLMVKLEQLHRAERLKGRLLKEASRSIDLGGECQRAARESYIRAVRITFVLGDRYKAAARRFQDLNFAQYEGGVK